jgi:predicted Zn-dependent protease
VRILIPLASLLVVVFSIITEWRSPAPDSQLCLYGGCRYDQIYTGIDAAGIPQKALQALILEDPSSPSVWCTYAEFLAANGDTAKAISAFNQALQLGPAMTPILVRVANFDFTLGRTDDGDRPSRARSKSVTQVG